MDVDNVNVGGWRESNDEWRSLFETSKDTGTKHCTKDCKYCFVLLMHIFYA